MWTEKVHAGLFVLGLLLLPHGVTEGGRMSGVLDLVLFIGVPCSRLVSMIGTKRENFNPVDDGEISLQQLLLWSFVR